MQDLINIKVNEEYIGQRLDSLISSLQKDISRSTVQRLIEEQNIKVNGKVVKYHIK